jgi:hypothetical protein
MKKNKSKLRLIVKPNGFNIESIDKYSKEFNKGYLAHQEKTIKVIKDNYTEVVNKHQDIWYYPQVLLLLDKINMEI